MIGESQVVVFVKKCDVLNIVSENDVSAEEILPPFAGKPETIRLDNHSISDTRIFRRDYVFCPSLQNDQSSLKGPDMLTLLSDLELAIKVALADLPLPQAAACFHKPDKVRERPVDHLSLVTGKRYCFSEKDGFQNAA